MEKEQDKDTDLYVAYGKSGDPAMFRILWDNWKRPILTLVRRVAAVSRAEAEDMTQEVFMTVIKERTRFKPEAKFSTWLYRIAVNRALNRIRDRKEIVSADDTLPDTHEPRPDAAAEASELSNTLSNTLALLPDRQRAAVVLREYEGKSYSEIADALQASEEAVESLLFHARSKLRTLLKGRTL